MTIQEQADAILACADQPADQADELLLRVAQDRDALLEALKWVRGVMVEHKTFCPANKDYNPPHIGACNCGMFRVHNAITQAERPR